METVAVYFERPLRTYGLEAQAGCRLLEVSCPRERLEDLLAALGALQPPAGLHFCTAAWAGETLSLRACLPVPEAARVATALAGAGLQPQAPVEASLVHLQGPHFGDRWGVASEALAGLAEAGVEPLGLAGVVHSLFLALPPQDARAGLAGLAKRFRAPDKEV